MKRFLISALLVFTLLVTACTSSNTTVDNSADSTSSGEDSVEETTSTSSSSKDTTSEGVDTTEDSSADTTEDSSVDSSEDSSIEISEDKVTNDSSVTDDSSAGQTDTPVVNTEPYVSNGVLISGTRGMEQYIGSPDSGTKFSQLVSKFKNDLGDGVEVYTIVAPHASSYYAPETGSYAYLLDRASLNFANLKEQSAANVHYIDVYNKLWAHTDEEIYPRTEHHWNALAAYYAAEEFAKAANVSFPSLETYEKIVKPGFVGTLYAFSKAAVLKNNPEDYVIYKPQAKYTAYYYKKGNYDLEKYDYVRDTIVYDSKSYAGAFIGGDTRSVKIVTENNTGRKLVIFKDSYGNAFAPFTVGSFDEVYILDIRYYKENGIKFCHDVGATDVAFVVSGFTATGTVYKHIETIRTAK